MFDAFHRMEIAGFAEADGAAPTCGRAAWSKRAAVGWPDVRSCDVGGARLPPYHFPCGSL
jgi:hypothetical protein